MQDGRSWAARHKVSLRIQASLLRPSPPLSPLPLVPSAAKRHSPSSCTRLRFQSTAVSCTERASRKPQTQTSPTAWPAPSLSLGRMAGERITGRLQNVASAPAACRCGAASQRAAPLLPPRRARRRAIAAPAAALLPEHVDAAVSGLNHLLTLAYEPVVLPCSSMNCGDIVYRRCGPAGQHRQHPFCAFCSCQHWTAS